MAINFEKIPSAIEVPLKPEPKTRTVLEELNERQHLIGERTIKCANIRPLYAKTKRPPQRYLYQYLCVCPSSKPQYKCKHTGNVIIDRDILTPQEHLIHLATPKANFAVPRKMPHYFVKKSIVANCTARIIRLAKPDKKQVTDTLSNFNNIISRRHKRSLEKCLEESSNVEYTTIKAAVELLREEKRLKKVAQRKEKLRCEQWKRKIVHKQKQHIEKIVSILFEEMKEFLLNDQFVMTEESPLAAVILEAIKDFTDKNLCMTSILREYQKTLAFNLAVWINKLLSNLNIHMPERSTQVLQMPQSGLHKPKQELSKFLPLDDYILQTGEKVSAHSEVGKSEQKTLSETEKHKEVSSLFLYSNVQENENAADNLQIPRNEYLAVEDLIPHSSSSEEIFFSAANQTNIS